MSMFQKIFGGGDTNSREVAKNRLQLVLVQDRVKLSPAEMDSLKDELIQVISKYVEIQHDGINISLTKEGRQSMLSADIPVVSSRQ